MKSKIVRMRKAFKQETAKRLPYIVGIFALLLLIGAYQSYQRTAETVRIGKGNTEIIKQQGVDIKLLTEQNRALAEQNNRLAQENTQHIDCITKLFVSFINTQGAPTNADIENCKTFVTGSSPAFPGAQPSNTAQGSAASPATSTNSTASPGNNGNGNGQGSQNNKPLNCTIDLLTLHIGCP